MIQLNFAARSTTRDLRIKLVLNSSFIVQRSSFNSSFIIPHSSFVPHGARRNGLTVS
jgi:hypothetical protein